MILRRVLAIAAAALAPVAMVAAMASAGPGVTYPPGRPPGAVATYATPALLAASPTAGLSAGAQAYASTTGGYTYQPSCTCTVGGVTCLGAAGGDGGLGCWVANAGGVPGANYVTQWYADSVAGSDSATCLGSGTSACKDFAEILRRIGDQPLSAQVNINLAGSYAGNSYTIRTRGRDEGGSYGYLTFVGTRTCAGTYTLTSYTAWSGASYQEGVAYVTADGGFDPGLTSTADGGYILQDNTGGRSGLGVLIGLKLDAGTFQTPGGSIVQSYTEAEPVAADSLSLCTLTKIATSAGTTLMVVDDGPLFENVQLGSGTSNAVEIALNAAFNFDAEMDSCIVAGASTSGPGVTLSYGSAWFGLRAYGRHDFWANLFDHIDIDSPSFVELSTHNLVGTAGGGAYVVDGDVDGHAHLLISGPVAVQSYTSKPCVAVDGQSTLAIGASSYLWCRGAGTGQPAYQVYAGSLLSYSTSNAQLGVTGTSATNPYTIGGVQYDGGGLLGAMPQYNTANGAGIVLRQ